MGVMDYYGNRSRQGLPFNLDAWDGYPANRDRVFSAIKSYANNVVVLAGDTHSFMGL